MAATAAVVGARTLHAESGALRAAGRPVELVVTAASPVTCRLQIFAIDGSGAPLPEDGSLVARTWPAPAARVQTLDDSRRLRSGNLTLRVSPDPLTITVEVEGRTVQTLQVDGESGAVRFAIGNRPVLGLGEGGAQFDRRGSLDLMKSGQGGYQLRTHGGRVPIPWLIGTDGWALFVHHPFGTFDLTGARGVFDPGGAGRALPIDLFVVAARDPAAIMAEYAGLTGHPGMPPLWAFGYQQSHRTLGSREEILDEARTFREKKLPCDTLIYLGTGFCPSGWNTNNGEFAFNPNVFPDPGAMIRQLHDEHFKVVLHAVLEGHTLTGTVDDPCTAAPLPSGRTPDGKWPADRQVSCYWPAHEPIAATGIDGWWPDQGDGLDGPSRLARIRMYWDGMRELRPGERPFALHRNGYPGMQRYAAFLWSGDVYSTWETLRTHVSVGINSGLSGIPFWGTDIGGFVPTTELTGELYVRWFQFGAFCPLFRAHGRTWKLRLPWGWDTGELGPDEIANDTGGAANPDPGELHNAAVEPICRKYLDLRYQLLPYTYSHVHQAHVTGLPLMRALWLHYPDDEVAVARGDEFLWGRDILVAPVTEKRAAARRLYVPRGRWYDFWTAEAIDGGREITRAVDLSTMPLLVRAGAVLPLGPVKQFVEEEVGAPLVLRVYPGADGAFALYQDDGRTFEYARGAWTGIDLSWRDRDRRLTLRSAPGSRAASMPVRVTLAGSNRMRDVVFRGQPLDVTL